ncbi:ABC transporter ATP-binding protein [Methylococcus sp. EFPC2]|uniref:ABC transporter ATP-binding protein n=1 Tax=Methylococcus sp. EFPC2 TaxID=2812648 RepID=UPI00196755BD|nr:sn-glycerol-3-phosphate ABC transporter ATP-binding protein UgpC [Methylococcus sp. EFPC2]QSA98733.1 sn-glycerol-3-phosphate ABC transporter ATP-binding protein UgpC [Methylococcus sp. EFPC2]
MATVVFEQVAKTYPNGHRAIAGLDLAIEDGELMVFVGPSGCGKSTLLRMLAGLEDISSGRISIGGREANRLSPQERNIAMVFQDYALYPTMTVRGNLEFPLKMRGLGKAEIARRVDAVARMLELDELLSRLPKQLSGGQRQRVAMGRALVREPAVFLMDEPLSNLDAKLRVQVRAEIGELQKRIGATMIYVTHDQVEAMTLGDRIAVLHGGRLQQVADPKTLYERPANAFVAGFIGSPPMNLFATRLVADEDGPIRIRLGDQVLLAEPRGLSRESLTGSRDQPFTAGIRPEAFTLVEEDGAGVLRAQAVLVEYLGHETLLHFRPQGEGDHPQLVARLAGMHMFHKGEALLVRVCPSDIALFPEPLPAGAPSDAVSDDPAGDA